MTENHGVLKRMQKASLSGHYVFEVLYRRELFAGLQQAI